MVFNSLLLSILLCSSYIQLSYCSKLDGVTRKDDIPFVKCQLCEKLAKELYEQVHDKQAKISPNKITEYDIIEISENVCNLVHLQLVEQNFEGQSAGSECKTIERACQEFIGYYDTNVSEYIYKMKPRMSSLVNFLCKNLTEACNTKPLPVPKRRKMDEKPDAKAIIGKVLSLIKAAQEKKGGN